MLQAASVSTIPKSLMSLSKMRSLIDCTPRANRADRLAAGQDGDSVTISSYVCAVIPMADCRKTI